MTEAVQVISWWVNHQWWIAVGTALTSLAAIAMAIVSFFQLRFARTEHQKASDALLAANEALSMAEDSRKLSATALLGAKEALERAENNEKLHNLSSRITIKYIAHLSEATGILGPEAIKVIHTVANNYDDIINPENRGKLRELIGNDLFEDIFGVDNTD